MDLKKLNRLIATVEENAKKLPGEAHEFFVDVTPIRTGNAKRSTKLKNDAINADYHYAGRLQEGRSRQAPDGMTEPTLDFIRKQVSRLNRG